MKLNHLILIALLAIYSNIALAQNNLKDKKYIFELDITKSMWGLAAKTNVDIFDQVREQLIKAIQEIDDPSSQIVLVTWQDKIINTWQEPATKQGKQNLIDQLKAINAKNVPGQNTNIYNAWMEAKKHVDPSKINIVYLLTDGRHSVNNPPIASLYQEIPKWQDFSAEKDAYMFVVELTSQAIDPNIRQAIEGTNKVDFIHGIEFYTLFLNNTAPIINLDESLTFSLDIAKGNLPSQYDNIPVVLSLDSELFEITNPNVTLKDTPSQIRLKLKKPLEQVKASLQETSILPIQVNLQEGDIKHVKLINKDINCKLVNKKEKVFYFQEI